MILNKDQLKEKVVALLTNADIYELIHIFNDLSQDCEGRVWQDTDGSIVYQEDY